MQNADRHRVIAEAVASSGSATVAELASLTGASEMTIRRDLDTLSAHGVLERVRGGARALLLRGEEPPFALRAHEGTEVKRRIGERVAALIADGETVVLDSGTTCLEVARLLKGRPVTVMPLSLQALQVLADAPAPTRLIVPGGQPRAAEGALIGPLTLASLAALRFDTAVLGCCGLSAADGLTAYDLEDAAVKKAALASSRRILAATDGSKIGHTAHAHVVPAGRLHTLVTDAGAPEDEITAIAEGGTVLEVVA
ncbi:MULTISPECIES: DeoR/GlpR family DNA-binding transcription regulator [Streptomyces]|jgi:DeoR/GlpR family transcriptional regulator of sugar metabolism|uniref:Lactose phosphotransferase system repressor n=1 Tax=Streptomyces griseoaurantiacus TaxID=68213 RepID=A0ABZ1VBE0_9ACTN|nr:MULTISPECIES: DeoR/GlpR family DNA-binding transcription regulator [Streptomyces]MDX3088498.1 DeoR/GlpR family DNA-binding transcription regulator [Streptomyces sp. ME12-02E]MDX3331973.1 DeoR/GlpR family DNA-binding transcription regulator [Streptomyces sp. ME02-6978a]MDX3358703.1 DeoR/GlpR family DNA-binding transcription regulator [Streptomyces sp. ME02-6978.2a]NJP73346.1 DeoR/GlpR transcriptional regulator [Streptomyces sp. C1-2]WTI25108.1 DeoR/GlpR family DNA-binding transcription regul